MASSRIKPKSSNGPERMSQPLRPAADLGSSANNTLEPSSGGIGIKLKTSRTKFINTKATNSTTKTLSGPASAANSRSNKPKTKIMTKLAAGPANPTKTCPKRGFFKFLGSKTTGRPQPKPAKSKNKVPKGSRCRKGFKDSRP